MVRVVPDESSAGAEFRRAVVGIADELSRRQEPAQNGVRYPQSMGSVRSLTILIGTMLAVLWLASCGGSSEQTTANSKDYFNDPVKEYPIEGVVISIDRDNNVAKIRHGAIGDWMGPMTMDFPVKDASDMEVLAEGENVNGTVYVKGIEYWIGDLSKAPAGSPAADDGAAAESGDMNGMDHSKMKMKGNMNEHEGMTH